jgi:hypothetical protein
MLLQNVPQLNGREREYLLDCLESIWISSRGKYSQAFEQSFADYCGVRFDLAGSSGTAALPLLALWKPLYPPRIKPGVPVRNDITMPPNLVNTLLYGIRRLESRLLPFLRLPFGPSVCLLAGKKAGEENKGRTGHFFIET